MFHFTCGEEKFAEKWKSLQMFFSRLSESFHFRFYFFENALKLQKWSVFGRKKVKSLHKHYPAAMGIAFSPNFAIDAKVKNSAFWNMPTTELH